MPHQAFVRVTGMRLGRFVEFEFSLNDADLTVELVMPPAAFQEFCAAHDATVLPPADTAAGTLAGLYRPPAAQGSQGDIRS
ncbi:phenol hydroxylase subunit [Novispirillum sp. DQ9]|uniref:phenol hydroxylase subunit n=1 Tax=Novispirillum sp. DQ9 TaxID=3398612 RepID=UPI003C7A8218